MDYRLLQDWEREVKESITEKTTALINRMLKSKPLFEEPYLQWMFDITPRYPVAYYCSMVTPRIFPKLWATLPFYKLNIIEIPINFRNKRDFRQYFGMDIETFKVLCEYERIQPIISSPTSYQNQHFLDPILRESPPCEVVTHALNIALTFLLDKKFLLDKRFEVSMTEQIKKVLDMSERQRRKYDADRFRRQYDPDPDPLSGRYDPDPFLGITFGIGFLLKLLVAGGIISFTSMAVQNPSFFDRVISMFNPAYKEMTDADRKKEEEFWRIVLIIVLVLGLVALGYFLYQWSRTKRLREFEEKLALKRIG